ncbi:AraC family transcriptional regulator [Clostridium sp. B9]|uniref:AraC family transcriptional regulator n=1 Tax=Clostridium sp. B9 TaxID=3423224 RepID=UPI003D2EA258
MSNYIYENHIHKDPKFPIIFHCDHLNSNRPSFLMHYHDSIEILYFLDGIGKIYCNNKIIQASTNDIVIINSNELHSIETINEYCKYYCLIIDKSILDKDIFPESSIFNNLITDNFIKTKFISIDNEFKNNNMFFKELIKSEVIQILIHLHRNYIQKENINVPTKNSNKIDMIKEIILFIKENFNTPISIDDICTHVSFSKYYVCRTFKEITGSTILDYINYIRCYNAKNLMLYKGYNISESAYKSGFNNLSYFSKTYKKHMGILPSKDNIT